MDRSGSCPQQTPAARPVRGPHGGWQQQEIERLAQCVSEGAQAGESLRSVFERVARELGRKPNSIRNFYYAQLRAQDADEPRALPFETFAQGEVEALVEQVLRARAQGLSVRACVRDMAGGDKTRMLRYQNKYRSTIRTRPELVHRVMARLAAAGVPYVSPYPQEESAAHEAPAPRIIRQEAYAGDQKLAGFFEGLDHLLALAQRAAQQDPPAQEAPAFPGESEALRRADRLSAHCDMLRIQLDDEQQRAKRLREEALGMVTMIKAFIALPESGRSEQTPLFCQQAAARLAAVEFALEQP